MGIGGNVKAKRRRETGNPTGEPIKTFTIGEEKWILAFRSQAGDYVNAKLYAIGRVTTNANYWLGFNIKSWKLTRNTSEAQLSKNRLELYSQTVEFLREKYGSPLVPFKSTCPTPKSTL